MVAADGPTNLRLVASLDEPPPMVVQVFTVAYTNDKLQLMVIFAEISIAMPGSTSTLPKATLMAGTAQKRRSRRR